MKTKFGHILHRPRLNGPLTPLVFGHCCVLGHVLRLTTLIPAGWTGSPPFAPLAHPDVIVTSTRTDRVGMNGSFRFFGTCGLPLDIIARTATSLNVAPTAASEDGTACTRQPRPMTWLLYERRLILRRIQPRLRMWLLHAHPLRLNGRPSGSFGRVFGRCCAYGHLL